MSNQTYFICTLCGMDKKTGKGNGKVIKDKSDSAYVPDLHLRHYHMDELVWAAMGNTHIIPFEGYSNTIAYKCDLCGGKVFKGHAQYNQDFHMRGLHMGPIIQQAVKKYITVISEHEYDIRKEHELDEIAKNRLRQQYG